jgi:hypothetical protein
MGLDDAGQHRTVQCAGQGFELYQQGCHRPALGRLEHAEPLVHQCGQIDARQKILCDNAKAANVTIYTVQVNTGGDATSAVLQYCASSADKFYLVTSASQTMTVFNSIGTSLSRLRVAK